MKKFILIICICISPFLFSQEEDSIELNEEQLSFILDSINNSFTFETGVIDIDNDLATLTVPHGFKFLDAEQSKYVLTDLWGNPPSEGTLGLLFPEDIYPMSDDFTYCVEIEYSDEGYIDDDDAIDLDYDDLLEEMQSDTEAGNPLREEQGYPTMELVGWASPPFYDEKEKKLHWAKEIMFEGEDASTLNYNIRVLGRSGFLNLNAIGDISMLNTFNRDRDNILASVEFNKGYRYSEFDPDIDKVAAYGIGGLIAGKVLAKVGFFAIIAKFGKFIAIGVIALFAGLRKRIFGSKESEG